MPDEELFPVAGLAPVAAEFRLDDNETAVLSRALEDVAIKAIETKYPELKARELLPLKQDVDPGADSVTVQEFDEAGMAEIIANFADDLPQSDGIASEYPSPVKSLGTSYFYSKQDMRRAALARRSGMQARLPDDRARRADKYIERAVDDVAAFGRAKFRLPGFLNHPNVSVITPSAPASGTDPSWLGGDKTGTEVLADMRRMPSVLNTTSKGVFMANTLVLPIAQYNFVAETPLNPTRDNQQTILQAFLEGQAKLDFGIRRVVPWYKLDRANAAGDGPRAVAYHMSDDNLELIIPMEATPSPPQATNLAWKVPVESRIGGCLIYQPLSVLYMDGI